MTKKQQRDLNSIEWFIPERMLGEITDADKSDFFNLSERGIKPKNETVGFKKLMEGKRWRGIHIGMYEEGVLEGSVPYVVLIEDMPEDVVWYIAKEMFCGIDREKIMSLASKISCYSN